jgi:RNA polymerase-binding protein DksA
MKTVAKKATTRKTTRKKSKASSGAKASGKKSRKGAEAARKTTKKAKTARKAVKKAAKKTRKTARRRVTRKLTGPQRAEFREMLLAKRRDILGDMDGISAGTLGAQRQSSGDLSNMPTHPADIGSDNFEQEFTLGLLESERALLQEINEALDRLEGGTYGICLGTGRPIALSRLRARPWAKYCIEYARLVEKGLVRPGETVDLDEDTED